MECRYRAVLRAFRGSVHVQLLIPVGSARPRWPRLAYNPTGMALDVSTSLYGYWVKSRFRQVAGSMFAAGNSLELFPKVRSGESSTGCSTTSTQFALFLVALSEGRNTLRKHRPNALIDITYW